MEGCWGAGAEGDEGKAVDSRAGVGATCAASAAGDMGEEGRPARTAGEGRTQ